MLIMYFFARSLKSVTELENLRFCLGKNPGPEAAGLVSAAVLASHCVHALAFLYSHGTRLSFVSAQV